MTVHADLPRAVAARGIVAYQPAFVVPACFLPDGVFELRDDGEGREGVVACRAGDAGGVTEVVGV